MPHQQLMDHGCRKGTVLIHRGFSFAALVRELDHVLQGIGDNIISFVDDTLITSESAKQYLEHLKELLTRLEKNNLTLNLSKSNFFKKGTKFLGFILTTEGIKLDEEKV